MATVLVSGCDRGLGREFVRQYAEAGHSVIATYLDNSVPRAEHPGVRHRALDVTNPEHYHALKHELGDAPIDILVSNAGIVTPTESLEAVDVEAMARVLAVNTIAPLQLAAAFAPNLAASGTGKLAFVSSRLGAITTNLTGGFYGYRASKAGLNAIARSLAIDLFPRRIRVIVLHPGWVGTTPEQEAPVTTVQSVAGMRAVIDRIGSHETGQFYDYSGRTLDW